VVSFTAFIRRFLQAEDFAAHGIAIGVDIGLLGGDPGGAHLGVGQHAGQHVVAQRFLQVDVALGHPLGDGAAHEVVVHHLLQRVARGVDWASGM
jgi:hypothetical protein